MDDRDFDATALLLLLPFALSLWRKYAPRSYANTTDERIFAIVLNGIKEEMRKDAELLATGELSQAEWELNFNRYNDAIYVLSTAMLAGTFDLTENMLALGSEEWRTQAGYAANAKAEVENGEQKKDGTLLVRVGLYAAAGWAMWQSLRGIEAETFMGAVEEERILGAADHCPDCLDEAAKGRQPIGTLRKIGDSVCRSNCHCTFVYYDAAGNVVEI